VDYEKGNLCVPRFRNAEPGRRCTAEAGPLIIPQSVARARSGTVVTQAQDVANLVYQRLQSAQCARPLTDPPSVRKEVTAFARCRLADLGDHWLADAAWQERRQASSCGVASQDLGLPLRLQRSSRNERLDTPSSTTSLSVVALGQSQLDAAARIVAMVPDRQRSATARALGLAHYEPRPSD